MENQRAAKKVMLVRGKTYFAFSKYSIKSTKINTAVILPGRIKEAALAASFHSAAPKYFIIDAVTIPLK